MSYEELQRAPYSVFQELYYKFWKENTSKDKNNGKSGSVDDIEDMIDEMT